MHPAPAFVLDRQREPVAVEGVAHLPRSPGSRCPPEVHRGLMGRPRPGTALVLQPPIRTSFGPRFGPRLPWRLVHLGLGCLPLPPGSVDVLCRRPHRHPHCRPVAGCSAGCRVPASPHPREGVSRWASFASCRKEPSSESGECARSIVDARIVAATQGDLPTSDRLSPFREDLLYRITGFPVLLPPLRDRPEDIPALARLSAERAARRSGQRPLELKQGDLELLSPRTRRPPKLGFHDSPGASSIFGVLSSHALLRRRSTVPAEGVQPMPTGTIAKVRPNGALRTEYGRKLNPPSPPAPPAGP